MKNDSSKFQLLKLSIKEFGYMLLCDVQYDSHDLDLDSVYLFSAIGGLL